MLTRAEQTIAVFIVIVSMYLTLFTSYIEIPDNIQQNIIPYLPFWGLVSFGAYLLGKLGYNVMTFHDVPEAHEELMAEIDMAKKDLRRLGVDVD